MNDIEYEIRKQKVDQKVKSVNSRIDKLNSDDTVEVSSGQLLELRREIEWIKSEMEDLEIYLEVEDFLLNGAGCKFDADYSENNIN